MRHTRRHEQPDGIGHLRRAAQRGQDAVVIIDRVSGRDERIVPAVVQKELAAPAEKLFQVRIGGVEQPVVQFVCEIDIVVEVERPEVPVRILEHDVLEMIRDDRKGIGPARHGAPPELAARLEAGKNRFRATRIGRARIDLFRRLHLRRRQARGPIVCRAEQRLWIEAAPHWIFDEAVLGTVGRVARLDRRFVNHRILLFRNVARRIFQRGLTNPQATEHEMRPEIGRRAGDDAVVVGGKTLRFREPLLAA